MNTDQINERAGVERDTIVMPFYLLCDVSGSMADDMGTLNDGVRRLWAAILEEPVVYDVAQVCIISFSDTARIITPMGQVSMGSVPTLGFHPGEYLTDYGSAFTFLAQAIRADVKALRDTGYKVYRPCAFFLTDGEPSDRDWSQTFTTQLTYDSATGIGMRSHPIFVPFGYRRASEQVLRHLAYPRDRGKWYQAKTDDVNQALKGIVEIIMNTVVNSANSAGTKTNKPTIIQQAPPEGSVIDQGDSDYDPDYVWE